MIDYKIRKIKESEYHLLDKFLYEAIFQREGETPITFDVIKEPELQVYIEDFGKESDSCLVAEVDGDIVGCVWTRILAGETKGFGNVDNGTPEFAISVLKEYRGSGIGSSLMKEMIIVLKEKGYKQTSLAVQKDNYAYKMYSSLGFETIKETEEEFIMIRTL